MCASKLRQQRLHLRDLDLLRLDDVFASSMASGFVPSATSVSAISTAPPPGAGIRGRVFAAAMPIQLACTAASTHLKAPPKWNARCTTTTPTPCCCAFAMQLDGLVTTELSQCVVCVEYGDGADVHDYVRLFAWARLGAYAGDGCQQVFVYTSRNGRRRYCSARCGNYDAVARHRADS